MEAPAHNLKDLKNILLMCWCRITNDILLEDSWSQCLDQSKLFWWREWELQNIRPVVLILWLISVYDKFLMLDRAACNTHRGNYFTKGT